MELSKCYLECAKLESEFKDENGNFKILTHNDAKFQIQILEILPIKKDSSENDYVIGFNTKRISTLEEKTLTLDILKIYYH